MCYMRAHAGDFEVTVNGTLLYSKKKTGTFPNMDTVSSIKWPVSLGQTSVLD